MQEINTLILTEYSIQIDDRCFYPIEVEAYFYDEDAFQIIMYIEMSYNKGVLANFTFTAGYEIKKDVSCIFAEDVISAYLLITESIIAF